MSTTAQVPPVAPPSYPPPNMPMPPTRPPVQNAQRPPAGTVPPPSAAFQGVCWFAFALGSLTYLYAVWYANVSVSDRYFLYTAFLFSCFGCLAAAKVVRDKQEGIPVSGLFYGLSYVAAIVPLVMVAYNLAYDSTVSDLSHRGLLGMSYAISAFAVLAIAKNERDRQAARRTN